MFKQAKYVVRSDILFLLVFCFFNIVERTTSSVREEGLERGIWPGHRGQGERTDGMAVKSQGEKEAQGRSRG